jgi:hypothetical protein
MLFWRTPPGRFTRDDGEFKCGRPFDYAQDRYPTLCDDKAVAKMGPPGGAREKPHVSDDETVANMGHPVFSTLEPEMTIKAERSIG